MLLRAEIRHSLRYQAAHRSPGAALRARGKVLLLQCSGKGILQAVSMGRGIPALAPSRQAWTALSATEAHAAMVFVHKLC